MDNYRGHMARYERESLERSTAVLFGDLWGPYDQQLFEESVQVFFTRLRLAGFDLTWFRNKTCLDAGCGGGRNTIAMARLGANEAIGIDLSEKGLLDAKRRARGLCNVRFARASILDIPFDPERFDIVWCAGVLMITSDENKALDELARVTKRGGYLYLLVYASGGLRWPLVQLLRPLAAEIGQASIERAIDLAGLPANKRRTFLDDMFCPRLDFYDWRRLEPMLRSRGLTKIQRWGPEVRLDHERNLDAYRKDLEALGALFAVGDSEELKLKRALFQAGSHAIQAAIDAIRWFERTVSAGKMSTDHAMDHVIGQGHHRVLAIKE